MKKVLTVLLGFFLLTYFVLVVRLDYMNKQVDEKQRQIENLKTELQGARTVRVRDSLNMSLSKVQTFSKEEVKESLPETTQFIREVVAPLKTVESIGITSTATTDTVYVPVDSTCSFSYHDMWTEITLTDTMLSYSVRDSLTTIVYQPYRHHFLWFRWGKKPAEISIVNHNPKSLVVYNRFVKVIR